jgi:carbon monoxide dehydrogenase subunit G
VYFEITVTIARPPQDIFAFLRDKDQFPQKSDSPVLVLEKTTPGAVGVGTQYREVVQMLPFVRGEFLSEITRYEPHRFLEEDFRGAGMKGHLAYEFVPEGTSTTLIQRESLELVGPLRLFGSVIEKLLSRHLQERLESIKNELEI